MQVPNPSTLFFLFLGVRNILNYWKYILAPPPALVAENVILSNYT